MNPRHLAHTVLVGLLLLLLGLSAPAQQINATAIQQDTLPTFASAELETAFITPQAADAHEIFRLANDLYGRWLYLEDRGGVNGEPVRNLQRLGDSLLVYDVAAQVAYIREQLQALDAQAVAAADAAADASAIETLQWAPRHVSIDSAWRALSGLQRSLVTRGASNEPQQSPNVTMAKEAGMLVLRETPERMAVLRSVLERVDQPEPQLLLTCMIITVDEQPAGPALPADLVADLSSLVPFESFSLLSLGVLRSSVRSERIEISMDDTWRLRLAPEAFDATSGRLTAKVMFEGSAQGFETRTTIGLGDYTVLGATGQAPIFVVLQARSLDAPARAQGGSTR